jgi:hypothetical protein
MSEVVRLDRDDGKVSLQSSYRFPTREAFDAYSSGPAVALRAEGLKLFAETGKVTELSRAVGVVQESWPS